MRVIVVTPPAPVVSYAEAAKRLKLSGTSQQGDVEKMIAGATAMFDAVTGSLGRAIGVQTLELRCADFSRRPGGSVKLPYPPVAAIVTVKYLDPDGIEQTLPSTDYELVGEDVIAAVGCNFPAVRAHPEAVRVRYSAGYDAVPENIANAILLAVGDMYRFRETIAMTTVSQLPSAASINSLLSPLQVYT